MKNDWPSKEQDLKEADHLLAKYLEHNEDEEINVLDVVINEEDKTIQVRASAWMLEIANYFNQKYGLQEGPAITQKVITQCLLKDVTIH